MPTHSIEGPGQPGQTWVTTEVAALWLGVSETTFLRLIGRKKGGTAALPGVAEWMHPHPHSEKTLWHVEDVWIIGRILRLRRPGSSPHPAAADDDGEKD